ncbi:hydantoinase/oxoprolinase family protein [Rhabdothermincola salaria]|uniref:hydantoinase/oxoprolinase family protein n=1 Tax=Rhabdothermincola salaria TaxID=2903142 RepID=UPI001E3D20A5|nr:hydantoinase/oxoprolinase family protein [Rhabdothermincola salaria]MCD9623417.1 hydantoinase/oxoprolinase family protein [Rhabdothermincola salaria]
MTRVGSDTGGTFTDLVTADGRIAKVPSTRDDPGRAVRDGLALLLGDEQAETLAHGTTVATNALLERKGARVALVTTAGFADVIEIARQDRPALYDQSATRPEPLVPRHLRLEVDERLAADGTELVPLGEIPVIPDVVDAVAVCLLHSDLEPGHEWVVGAELEFRGHDVSCSCDVSPEFREYERTVTTVVNAYLRPACRTYLRDLDDAADRVLVMTSAAGLVPARRAAERPAALLLSGPAGGVLAGAVAAAANGFPDAVTFDMGGTSTDVCLVLGGTPEPAAEREVAGFPVRMPSLDVHTIGAGGGSIAHLDDGGALVVGPESAGAEPGPACYGRGGRRPTVTDADLVAGRIPADAAFPGLGPLDRDAAETALAAAGVTADGVLAVVDAAMEEAIRVVTVERGVDPSGLALVAFGGAGPLHACALAEALDMAAVVVPARAGVLSAVGILGAPLRVDLVRSVVDPRDHAGARLLGHELVQEATTQLLAQAPPPPADRHDDLGAGLVGVTTAEHRVHSDVAFDCRYAGQSHELAVRHPGRFHREHRLRNGYERPEHPVEVIAVRVKAWIESPVGVDDLPAPDRVGAVGPAVLAEEDCTIWVPDGWVAELGAAGALVLRRVGQERS